MLGQVPMSPQLPNTIEGLRAALAGGQFSAQEVLRLQADRFASGAQRTLSVTHDLTVQDTSFDADKPLSGVALAHKDIFNLQDRAPGLGRNHGSCASGLASAAVIECLSQAGALNFGALAMAEDACAATGQTARLPTPLNPLDPALAVGGSSSGSAVAVASGMVYASLGTDTAGSVRIPAMTCGVMGLKTTHGLLDRRGMTLLSPSLDSVGVLARSVQDLEAVMRVLAPGLRWSVGRLRADYWLEGAELAAEVFEVIEPVMRRFGQSAVDLSGHEPRASVLQQLLMAYEVGQSQRERIVQKIACQQVASLGTLGLSIAKQWWVEALRQRAAHLDAFVDVAFADADVLMAPLQVDLLPQASEVYLGQANFKAAKLLGLHRYCGWVNYLGLPSLAMPVGLDKRGLPISIQLVGKPFCEPELLALGAQIQREMHGEQGIMPVLSK
jgi:aspartyl-tRNA(Asn)/glutamyl-tRNA(Gln) amidotransferase subunit A